MNMLMSDDLLETCYGQSIYSILAQQKIYTCKKAQAQNGISMLLAFRPAASYAELIEKLQDRAWKIMKF